MSIKLYAKSQNAVSQEINVSDCGGWGWEEQQETLQVD